MTIMSTGTPGHDSTAYSVRLRELRSARARVVSEMNRARHSNATDRARFRNWLERIDEQIHDLKLETSDS